MANETKSCRFCHRDIRAGERRFFSHQAGMRGDYHWECFVEACRQANRAGAHQIETITHSGNRDREIDYNLNTAG